MRFDGLPWITAGAVAVGTSHVAREKPCEDACRAWLIRNDLLLVAAADGAGSATHARDGAIRAVESACQFLISEDPLDMSSLAANHPKLLAAFRFARSHVVELARQQLDDPSATGVSHACTLTIALANAEGVLVAQRGDGAVVGHLTDTSTWHVIAKPQNGEYANQTFFLTDQGGGSEVSISASGPVSFLSVMSDGITPLAILEQDDSAHPGFFEPLEQFAMAIEDSDAANKALSNFLISERTNRRTADDKTLFIAYRRYSDTPVSALRER